MAFNRFLRYLQDEKSEAKPEAKSEVKPKVEPRLLEIKLDSLKRDIEITKEGLRKLKAGQEASEDEESHLEHFPKYLNQLKDFLQEIDQKKNIELTIKSKNVLNEALQLEKRIVFRLFVVSIKQVLGFVGINVSSDLLQLRLSVHACELGGDHYHASVVLPGENLRLQKNEEKSNSTSMIFALFVVEQKNRDNYRAHGDVQLLNSDQNRKAPEPSPPTDTSRLAPMFSHMFHIHKKTPEMVSTAPLLPEEPKNSSGIRRSKSF